MSESNMQNTHSPYTPDTGKVRTAYIHGVGGTTWYKGKADALLKHFDRWLAEVKAEAWEEGQLALLEYMGVPLYHSKGDEPRNPKQPRNPYRQDAK